MQSKKALAAVFLIFPILLFFLVFLKPTSATAAANRFSVTLSDLKLLTNNGRPLPYESQQLPPSDRPVQVIVQGKIKVSGGQLKGLYVLTDGSGSAVWSQRGNAQVPAQGMDWSGSVMVNPGQTVHMSIMATGSDTGNPRDERRYTFAESVILLSGTASSYDRRSPPPTSFEAEFKDVKLVLNSAVPPTFKSRTLTDSDFFSPWNRQVGVTGTIVIKKGELLWLDAVGNEQSTTILQRALASRPMTAGTENFFSANFNLDPEQPLAILLKATGLNAEGNDQGPSVFYPTKPVVLTYKPPKQIQVSSFKVTPKSRRLLVDSTSTGGTGMNFADAQNGYIYETVKSSIFNVFNVTWNLEGGKVTKVEYTKDGSHWIEEKSLQVDPTTGAIIGVNNSWNAKPGESFNIAVRITGIDTDQDGNPVSGPKVFTDTVSAKLKVMKKGFKAVFTQLHFKAPEIDSDFKTLPPEGVKIISAEPVPVMLTVAWTVQSGKVLRALYSVDGGKKWEEAKITGPGVAQAGVSAAPGESLDILFKLQGRIAEAESQAPDEDVDSIHAKITIEKPASIALDAGFMNQAFYEEDGSAPLKYFSDLGGKTFDYSVTQDPARLAAQVTWWKKTGVLESVGVSFDGGKRWETTLIDPGKNFWTVSVLLSPNQSQDIVFQLQGYDQDAQGRRVGSLKTITDTLHGKISGKGVGTPFQANFKDAAVILSGKTIKFSDLPADGFSYALDPKNPKIGIKTTFDFKGYLTLLIISKDGGKTEWDSVLFQPGQATGKHTFELPVKSGDNLDLVFSLEGFNVDPWGRPTGQHKSISDMQHGKIKVIPPPISTFHDQGLGIGNDSIMFPTIPAEGLRISSALPVPIYAWSELAIKGSRVKKGFFSTDGGKNWQAFQSVSNSNISGEIAKAKPGQKLDIVFKIEQVPVDANGNEMGPPTELIDENHVRVEIIPPNGFDAAVNFSEQEIRIGDKTFSFDKIDPVEGLVFESSNVVRLDMSASISIPDKNVVAKTGAIYNGKDTVEFNLLNNKRKGRIMGYLYPAPGQTLDLAFVCEIQGLDTAGKPIPGAVKAVQDTLQRKVTIRKPIPHPFKAEFVKKTVKIGDEIKNFSDLPAVGWTYETSDSSGAAAYTVSWRLDSGYLKQVLCSTDGGATWLTRTIGDDESPDTHTFEARFESTDAPGNTQSVVCALEGVDVDENGKEISDFKRIQEDTPVKILFVKTDKPKVEVSDIKINGDPLEDISPVIPMQEVKDGIVRITGRLQANTSVDHLMLSLDGGTKWEELEAKPEWEYLFKPVTEESYEVVFKAVLNDGSVVEISGYPKTRFRFVGSAESVENAEEVLQEMARAYENKDYSAFISRISDDFPNRGELEEFVRRDFRDFDGVKVNLFIKNTVDTPDGKSVQVDWEMRYSPSAVATQVVAKGQSLDFIFISEAGRLKLLKMRGANPLFGARSPDIAAASGVGSGIAATLQKIEDEGSRESKATALNIVASELKTKTQFIPVTFEILDAFAHYLDGAQEEVDFDAVQPARQISGEARIRITDNPKNFDFAGLQLEITDSLSGARVTFTGDLQANQEVVFRTTDPIIFNPADSGKSSRLTFTLDPADTFIAIDREKKTVRQDYTIV